MIRKVCCYFPSAEIRSSFVVHCSRRCLKNNSFPESGIDLLYVVPGTFDRYEHTIACCDGNNERATDATQYMYCHTIHALSHNTGIVTQYMYCLLSRRCTRRAII